MKHFEELLLTLGGKEPTLIEESEHWALWNVVFPTPAAQVKASYLHLKNKCPLKAATEAAISFWSKSSNSGKYEVVVSPQHQLARDLGNTRQQFKAVAAHTSHSLLFNNLLSSLEFRSAESEEFFIDPSLLTSSRSNPVQATRFLTNWLLGLNDPQNKEACLAVVKAHGGIGKTTLCREVCNKIQQSSKTVLPILIESSQWQAHLSPTLHMKDIWDIAISRTFAVPSRLLSNEMALRVLVKEGIFVPILDGFDELCLSPSSNHGAEEIIQRLLEMIEDEDGSTNARILLTSRETFWSSLDERVKTDSMEVFTLLGFSNDQKQDYFRKRLSDPSEQQVALRLATNVSGKIYEKLDIEGQNAERPEGVPFILDMIASYVHENPDSNTINPYQVDSLAPLLEAMCRRENTRQKLGISHVNQLILFEELFREFPEKIAPSDLNDYLAIICETNDTAVWQRFQSHVFLKRHLDGSFGAKYEVLRIYFVASFLAKSLCDVTTGHRKKVASLLADNASGSSEIIDWLVSQIKSMEADRLRQAIQHAKQIISDPENNREFKPAGSAFCNVLMRLIPGEDKQIRKEVLLDYAGDPRSATIERMVFAGQVRTFDFRRISFTNCVFQNVDFRNCVYDDTTRFVNCDFCGTFEINNCEGIEKIELSGCKFSNHAELVWDKILAKKSRSEVKLILAEEALFAVLKKFKGPFGFSSIQYRRRLAGLPPSNPYNKAIWEVLLSHRIIERHAISNVAEGGLNVADATEIRREMRKFIDNGVLGHALSSVLHDLVED